jgi:hypothetical protein
MAALNLAGTMDALAAKVPASAYRVHPWPVESITPPCVVVGYPTTIEFDSTMGRGSDRWVVPVWYAVGATGTKDARDALSAILNDTSSVKSALDGTQSFGDVRVMSAEVAELVVAGVTYLAAKFDCEVFG